MNNDIKKVSVSKEQIQEICVRLGTQISKDFEGKVPHFLGLLNGCNPFMSDLLKEVTIPCTLDYIKVSSYEGTTSTGNVRIKGENPKVEGKDVIIVDDILDTGRTLKAVKELIMSLGAKSVTICVLLDKPDGGVVKI